MWNEDHQGAWDEGELTHFFSRVFFRMKAMSFFSSRMQTRSPMTPPTTARMMRVTVLSTSSTGEGGRAEQGREDSGKPPHKVQN